MRATSLMLICHFISSRIKYRWPCTCFNHELFLIMYRQIGTFPTKNLVVTTLMNNYLSCPVLACSSLNPRSTHDLPRPYQIYHALRVPGVVYGIALCYAGISIEKLNRSTCMCSKHHCSINCFSLIVQTYPVRYFSCSTLLSASMAVVVLISVDNPKHLMNHFTDPRSPMLAQYLLQQRLQQQNAELHAHAVGSHRSGHNCRVTMFPLLI